MIPSSLIYLRAETTESTPSRAEQDNAVLARGQKQRIPFPETSQCGEAFMLLSFQK
mgnify:CR=1 FL=1